VKIRSESERNYDEVDSEEAVDLDEMGVGDIVGHNVPLAPGDGLGTYDQMSRELNNLLDEKELEEMAEEALRDTFAEMDREYENYSPPFRDDEDEYDDGEQDEEKDRR
jgi:hypothetical protein